MVQGGPKNGGVGSNHQTGIEVNSQQVRNYSKLLSDQAKNSANDII